MLHVPTVTEVEIRCEHCAVRHPERKAPLLATRRGPEILEPVRLDGRTAKRLGIPRSGLFWARPAVRDGCAALRCRRCKTLTLLPI